MSDMDEIGEDHPIWQAIDSGGGQTCDVRGVLRALAERGWQVVPVEPTPEMINAAADQYVAGAPYESAVGPDGAFARLYRAMLAAAKGWRMDRRE